jgi:hypothetical protein
LNDEIKNTKKTYKKAMGKKLQIKRMRKDSQISLIKGAAMKL